MNKRQNKPSQKVRLNIKNKYKPTKDFLRLLNEECVHKLCNNIPCDKCELIRYSKRILGYDYLRLDAFK